MQLIIISVIGPSCLDCCLTFFCCSFRFTCFPRFLLMNFHLRISADSQMRMGIAATGLNCTINMLRRLTLMGIIFRRHILSEKMDNPGCPIKTLLPSAHFCFGQKPDHHSIKLSDNHTERYRLGISCSGLGNRQFMEEYRF